MLSKNIGFAKPVTVPFSKIHISAPKTESDVFEHTICGCTSFNTRGNGHPLLVNKKTTARIASTGTLYKTSDVAWDELQEWQVQDSIVDRALLLTGH